MLRVSGLTSGYGDKITLRDVNLSLCGGEILAVIGPNGAGKTTLVRAISGLLPIRSGTIYYEEEDLMTCSPKVRARLLAVVPQAEQSGGAFTVEQAVMLGRTPHMGWLGHPVDKDKKFVLQSLERVNMAHLAERRIAELSGGERQRVMLARALAQDTPLLLMDEPTSHLDLKYQTALLSLIRKLVVDSKVGVLMALHDLNLVSLYADRVIILVEGSVSIQGKPSEVLTVENIKNAYGTNVRVLPHPQMSKVPLIFPDP
jgi:iron complex transport system ATP-binding protein